MSCDNPALLEKFDDLDQLVKNCDESKLSKEKMPRSRSQKIEYI
jgi:hypothetical protein